MNRSSVKKLVLLALIAVAITCFFLFDLDRYLTLEALKESRERFDALYQERTALVIAVYFAVYVAVTALSLPGALVVSLAGGAMFGTVTGTVVVSFASTLGATLACAVSRFLLRDWVRAKFARAIARIDEGVEREGAFYLFTLRLIPVFPFFVINLAMGLTNMRLWTYAWVSQLGMLAGTIVFVNAGAELGQVASVSDIMSPSLLISFALLGIFPLVVKKAVDFVRKKRGEDGQV